MKLEIGQNLSVILFFALIIVIWAIHAAEKIAPVIWQNG